MAVIEKVIEKPGPQAKFLGMPLIIFSF